MSAIARVLLGIWQVHKRENVPTKHWSYDLDPTTRDTTVAQKLLLEIPKQTNIMAVCDKEIFQLEVRRCNVDRSQTVQISISKLTNGGLKCFLTCVHF